MKQLQRFLRKIDAGQPIDLNKFFKAVDQLGLEPKRKPEDVEAAKVAGSNLYRVQSISESLKQRLDTLVSDTSANASAPEMRCMPSRKAAARQNRSHHAKVDGSLMILRKLDGLPAVLTFKADGAFVPNWVQAKGALLIENRQNFIDAAISVELIRQSGGVELPFELDIVLADGNQISNSNHAKFLAGYEHLYGFFDLDLGGLTIAKNIIELLPTCRFTFVLPLDSESRLANVVVPASSDSLEKVAALGQRYAELADPASLILKHRKTLEQEAYLS
jgi:hypothetical protein